MKYTRSAILIDLSNARLRSPPAPAQRSSYAVAQVRGDLARAVAEKKGSAEDVPAWRRECECGYVY